MNIHRPTLIRVIRSIIASPLDDEDKGRIVGIVLHDACATDPTIEPEKVLRGAGFVVSNIEIPGVRH